MSEFVVEDYLAALVEAGAPAVIAPPRLAQRVLTRQRRRRRWLAVLGASALVAAGAGATGARLAHSGPQFALIEPSGSMQPTIAIGESVIADRRLDPAHGDVVVVKLTLDGSAFESIKRVIGLPGDTVACPDDGTGHCDGLILNGDPLVESYLPANQQSAFPAITVPSGSMLLLGDHRNASRDSRQYGPVDDEALEGVVINIVDSDGQRRSVPGAPAHPNADDSVDPTGPVPPAQVSTP
jgi:signal peptidase I